MQEQPYLEKISPPDNSKYKVEYSTQDIYDLEFKIDSKTDVIVSINKDTKQIEEILVTRDGQTIFDGKKSQKGVIEIKGRSMESAVDFSEWQKFIDDKIILVVLKKW